MAQAAYAFEGTGEGERRGEGRGEPGAKDAPRLSVSLFADDAGLRQSIGEDVTAAGFRLGEMDTLAALLDGPVRALGDVVVVDCPVVDGAACAALARLDMRIARSGAALVVSTSVEGLDAVFACLDQSSPELLVDPTRSERVIALGRILGRVPRMRVRDLPDDERLSLLRLTEQVSRIAERVEQLAQAGEERGAFRFNAKKDGYRGPGGADAEGGTLRRSRAPLPDPRLVRRIIAQRRKRAEFFDPDLFADPAWDMLLDLTAARAEHERVSVTSLCIASGVPATTALRWIKQLVEIGLFQRIEDDGDKRRAFIALSDRTADAMARYFAALDDPAALL